MEQNTKHFQDPAFASAMMSMVRCGEGTKSPSDIAWQFCNDVQKGLQLDDVVLYLLDDDEKELVQTAAAGPKSISGRDILHPIRIPVGSGIVGTVAKMGRAEIIADTSLDRRYILDDEQRYSEISVPIIQSGRLIGVLDSEYRTRGFYNSDHLEKLELIASVASTHLARVMAENQLKEVSQQRHQLERIAAQQLDGNEQLDSIEKWLSRRNRSVTQILHHELRTPLNAIVAVSDLLDGICNANEVRGEELLPFATMLRHNGQELSNRITDLLEFPGLSDSGDTGSMQEVDVNSLMEDLRLRAEYKLQQQGLKLELETSGKPSYLTCDPIALSKVFHCLIDNAAKFSNHGTVLVRLVSNVHGKPRKIAVIDQGIGVETADIDRIFEPFFQVDQGLSRHYGGLGLGLPIARRLCHSMGFELEVDSQPDQGSTFVVNFGVGG